MDRRTFMPDVAGVLMIGVLVAVIAWPFAPPNARMIHETVGCIAVPLCTPGFLLWVVPLLPIVGAVSCLRRRHLSLALISAIFGIFSVGALYAGSLLSFTASVLILSSRDEFGRDFAVVERWLEQRKARAREGAAGD